MISLYPIEKEKILGCFECVNFTGVIHVIFDRGFLFCSAQPDIYFCIPDKGYLKSKPNYNPNCLLDHENF